MFIFVVSAFPTLAHTGIFPDPVICAPDPLHAPVSPCFKSITTISRPALRRTETDSTAASDDLGDDDDPSACSRTPTHGSAMSAIRRVRSLPGLGLRRMASRASLTAWSPSSTSSADDAEQAAASSASSPSGLSRFFGRLVRRGRGRGRDRAPAEGAAEGAGFRADVHADARPARHVVRHVSFADQPELTESRGDTAGDVRRPTSRPRAAAALTADDNDDDNDEDGSEGEEGDMAGEYVSLLRERRQVEEFIHSRKEPWWRASDEYYALAFPWC